MRNNYGLSLFHKEKTGEALIRAHKLGRTVSSINWMNFEAHQSIQSDNYLAVVKLKESYAVPQELKERYWWIAGFSERNVIQVLKD